MLVFLPLIFVLAPVPALSGELLEGYWDQTSIDEILDKTLTVHLGPDISGLSADERATLDDLVERAGAVSDVGRPRLWLDRVFAAKGSGAVGTGTLVGGELRYDQRECDHIDR